VPKPEQTYKTGVQFTCLLLKESAANDGINVSLFAYDKNYEKKLQMLTKEDNTLIKNVWESEKNGVKRLIKEFPNKKWSNRGVEDF